MVAASAYFYNGQLDLLEQAAQAAMARDPYDAEIPAIFGYMVAISGQWQRGVALGKRRTRLIPIPLPDGIKRRCPSIPICTATTSVHSS